MKYSTTNTTRIPMYIIGGAFKARQVTTQIAASTPITISNLTLGFIDNSP
jgi:hypothetical protein